MTTQELLDVLKLDEAGQAEFIYNSEYLDNLTDRLGIMDAAVSLHIGGYRFGDGIYRLAFELEEKALWKARKSKSENALYNCVLCRCKRTPIEIIIASLIVLESEEK